MVQRVHRIGGALYWPLAFLGLGAELVDGVTRAMMPDAFELNPVSLLLGGHGSLIAKLGLLAYLGFIFWTFDRGGARRVGYVVAVCAVAIGFLGALSNLGAIL